MIRSRLPLELFCWVFAIVYLAWLSPEVDAASWCIFRSLGISWCPGCGIGHAISYLLHGELRSSLTAHPLGVVALLILLHRIKVLAQIYFKSRRKAVVTLKTYS